MQLIQDAAEEAFESGDIALSTILAKEVIERARDFVNRRDGRCLN